MLREVPGASQDKVSNQNVPLSSVFSWKESATHLPYLPHPSAGEETLAPLKTWLFKFHLCFWKISTEVWTRKGRRCGWYTWEWKHMKSRAPHINNGYNLPGKWPDSNGISDCLVLLGRLKIKSLTSWRLAGGGTMRDSCRKGLSCPLRCQ